MNTTESCPQCGAALPANAPESLCPACLMSGALISKDDPGATLIVEKPKARALPSVGETFGGYRIERELGRGGMGAVYAAEHLESGRRVALKVLSHQLDSPEARARFLREGRLAASINHPNSVYVFGTEEIEGTPAIAMELIAGGTLQDRIQRGGALPIGEAVDAVLQIIAGLEAAQAVGILHRDIKPANCFTDLDGSVKVGDFGLSISTQGRGDSLHTIDGTFLGTPAFCSPEQLRGEELNVRSDMYSVGVTLFYLLTGRTPFEGKNMVQLLANALEKAPPAPTQFRVEIPKSLSRVVLRCLEKLPSARFGSYAELRQALTPFGSTAPTPATLGLRFVADVADRLMLVVVNWAVMLACMPGILDLTDPGVYRSERMVWSSVAVFSLHLLYFGILEGVWGASLGKRMVGLRVVRLNREVPGVARALARVFLLTWPSLLNLLVFKYDPDMTSSMPWAWGHLVFASVFVLALFSCARRHNGFAAWHDIWTGTRVIQKAALVSRAGTTTSETPVTTNEEMPRVGPYHVIATLASTEEQTLLLGYDTRLLRKVWIRKTAAGTPPVPPNLRNVSRSNRLRWLQGERTASGSWDAYEAVGGKALTGLLGERQPWQSVRLWLHDLATELETARKDGSLPAMLSLDQVWITNEGRAKLLDFPMGGSGECMPEPRLLLNQLATSALEGRLTSIDETSRRSAVVPLPLKARALLHDLTVSSADGFAGKLTVLLREPACVPRWKRLVMTLASVMPVVFVGMFMMLGQLMVQRMKTSQPDFLPFVGCMTFHEDLVKGNHPAKHETFNGAEMKAALEVHIAGRYGHIIRDAQWWHSPMYKSALRPQAREAAERMVREHPHPSEEEMRQADAMLKPHISKLEDPRERENEAPEMKRMMSTVAAIMVNSLLTMIAVLSLLCALLFRRGPLFRILGIDMVTGDGTRASRLRMLGRGFVAWSPVLFSTLLMWIITKRGIGPQQDETPLFLSLALLLTALAITSLMQKERGLQDTLAGTWPVPE